MHELLQGHGMSLTELAQQLGTSTSWISRRLALLTVLPERVHELVRSGALCTYAAQKYLVPLARANAADCEALAEALAGAPVSARDLQRLYAAWRAGTRETRRRLVQAPRLFLAAAATVELGSEPPAGADSISPAHSISPAEQLTSELAELATRCARVGELLAAWQAPMPAPVRQTWDHTRSRMTALIRHMEDTFDVGQRYPTSRVAAGESGTRNPGDCPADAPVAPLGP